MKLATPVSGLWSATQLLSVPGVAPWRMNVVLMSVRTATSPVWAVRDSMAAWLETTNVSEIAIAGVWAANSLPDASRLAGPSGWPSWATVRQGTNVSVPVPLLVSWPDALAVGHEYETPWIDRLVATTLLPEASIPTTPLGWLIAERATAPTWAAE